MTYTKDLKKGMKVKYFNAVLIITDDAVNIGGDVYTANCKYVEEGAEQIRPILKAYKYFKSNCTVPLWEVID